MLKQKFEIDGIGRALINIVGNTGLGFNHMVKLTNPDTDEETLAKVIRVSEDETTLQLLTGTFDLPTNATITSLGESMTVSYSGDIGGRFFDGTGKPIDGRGPLSFAQKIDIESVTLNPAVRLIPNQMMETGIPGIDVFNTLVKSQKVPFFAAPGEPYNKLLANIAANAKVDAIIIGGMGLKYDEYQYFRDELSKSGNLDKTTMFVHIAGEPIGQGLLVPDTALSTAKMMMNDGKDVLVILTDMTNWANFLRDIANYQDNVPSLQGYPGDLYSQLATRYETAADMEGAGSITILGATTLESVEDPVPDNTGYITEGQFFIVDGKLKLFGSLSRLKQNVNADTRPDHRKVVDAVSQLMQQAEKAHEASLIGSGDDPFSIKLRQFRTDFINQLENPFNSMSLFEGLDLCWELLAKYFDPIQVGVPTELLKDYWPNYQAEA